MTRRDAARLELVRVGEGGGREDGEDASEAAGDEEGRRNLVARALILLLNLQCVALGDLGFVVLRAFGFDLRQVCVLISRPSSHFDRVIADL
jgi:hypothetical protein